MGRSRRQTNCRNRYPGIDMSILSNRQSVELIAEVGQAHDGSLGILHSYIDALATTGVNTIKFQIHIAEAESSYLEPFRIKFSLEDETRFDYWKRMSFSFEQWQQIKKHCEEKGLNFLASPFSCAAVDLLEALNVDRYKIGSGEVSNFLMLEKIAKTGKGIILSSGMSSFSELNAAIELIAAYGNQISILQCTTSYPTPPEELGLNVIEELRQKYPNRAIGLSEHTGQIYAAIAAVALGAKILEFHAVFDRRMFGPDATSSLTIDEIATLVLQVRQLETVLNSPVDKKDNANFSSLKKIFEKSLSVNRNMSKGDEITLADLESKKPADAGITASRYREIIGKKLIRDLPKWSFLNESDLTDA